MATISLGKAPKNFKKLITVKMLDGTEGTIECLFKYRTVSAYGAFRDEMAKDSGLADPASITWAEIFEKRRDKGGEYLSHILDGWNLDVDFNHANAQQLCDELPGAASAIVDAYHAASVEGRLGN